jgi:small subunit ribosomal protein S6
MKRGYETVLIVDGTLSDEKVESVIKSVETHLGKKAELKNIDRRGKRRLAYPIKRKSHGHYTVFTYEAEGEVIAELEHRLRLDETVLRFLTVLHKGAENPSGDANRDQGQ